MDAPSTRPAADSASPLLTPGAALAFLYDRINYERAAEIPYSSGFKLERMRQLLARLGNPQEHLAVVHVAGTKGKGSTATMIAQVLTCAGYRTGLYTSPHLQRVEERIAVDGQCCAPSELVELVGRVRDVVQQMDHEAAAVGGGVRGPTYFEVTTALAMLYFLDRKVELAVLEVGLGGRLDSTNICHPRVAVITSISYDHTRQLGNTLAAIAQEKAGIIKPQVPVVTGVTEQEPLEVIRRIARQHDSPLYCLGEDFQYSVSPDDAHAASLRGDLTPRFDYRSRANTQLSALDNLALQLLGRHQVANAAVAVAALEVLIRQGSTLTEAQVRSGLGQAHCPARIEVVRRQPDVIIDAAHNVASMEALVAVLDERFAPAAGRRVLIFATSKDKDAAGMLRLLLPRFDRVLLTRYLDNPRSITSEHLLEVAHQLQQPDRQPAWGGDADRIRGCHDPAAAWQEALNGLEVNDLVCVTGSFYIAAEVRRHIQDEIVACAKAAS